MAQLSVRLPRRGTVILALASSVLLAACGGGGNSTSTTSCDNFDCQALLDNLASNVMEPTFTAFRAEAQELQAAVGAYCTAIGGVEEAAAHDAVRDAWASTMGVWQQAEVMQVGPLIDNSKALHDTIYSWPASKSCGVDQEIINAESGEYDISGVSATRRGLDALEYLLFRADYTLTCPLTSSSPQALQDWDERPELERRVANCGYAEEAAADLAAQAGALVTGWQAFRQDLADPAASSRFKNVEEAVNHVSDALFYVEKQTKDAKLGMVLGLKECDRTPCLVESPYSNSSLANIENNLLGFQKLFHGGGTGLGFDAYLDELGGENTSVFMEQGIETSLLAVRGIEGTLAAAIEQSDTSVTEAHAEIKKITDRLKQDFLEVLGLSIPGSSAGDGD